MRRVLPGMSAAVLSATALVTTFGPPAFAAGTSPTASGTVVAWGTTASAAAGYRGTLYGAAAAGPADVWAVGAYNPDSSVSQVLDKPYAEHWNGSAWTATPVAAPSLYSTHQAAELNGAAAVGPGEAWAVGDVSDLWTIASQTLAYHWTGAAWTRTTTPDPAGTSQQQPAAGRRGAQRHRRVGGRLLRLPADLPSRTLERNGVGDGGRTEHRRIAGSSGRRTARLDAGISGIERFDGSRWSALPAPPVISGSLYLHALAPTSSGLWTVGTVQTPYFEGYIDHSYAAVFNNGAWSTIGLGGSGLTGATASGPTVLAAAPNDGVFRLSTAGASQEVTPAPGTVYPQAVAADSAGNAWATGFASNGTGRIPGIIDAPGIGQGGIIVNTGAANATVTWTGPVNHSGTADVSGHFSVGGLPDGTYTVTSSYSGSNPGVATATVTAGIATPSTPTSPADAAPAKDRPPNRHATKPTARRSRPRRTARAVGTDKPSAPDQGDAQVTRWAREVSADSALALIT